MGPSLDDLEQRLAFAIEVAAEASHLILSFYQRSDLEVEKKGDLTPVTAADRGAEELIRARLATRFPADGVLGEEFPETPGTSGFRWILDPVDGTKSFVHGVPLFGTLIGVEYQSECVVGVCRFPALNEVVYARRGGGCWWQVGEEAPRRCQVSQVTQLAEATFCQTNMLRWEAVGHWSALMTMLRSCGLARGWGDCFGHVLVATGRAEVMVDPSMNPWDAAALVPIIQEAGGVFMDWSGACTIYGGSGISIVPALRDHVLEILQQS